MIAGGEFIMNNTTRSNNSQSKSSGQSKQMQEENVPFTLKELAVNGVDLLSVGIPPYHLSQTLKQLLLHTAAFPEDNVKERLAKLAVGIEKSL